jgi:phage gp36-like protein
MAYSLYADVLEKMPSESVLIELTDDADDPTGEVNATKVTNAIVWADGRIDGYLGQRMTVPLTTIPETVKALSVDLAIYDLYTQKEALPERREDRYKAAIEFLKDIAAGKVTIGTSGVDDETSAQWPLTYSLEQDFDADVWDTY